MKKSELSWKTGKDGIVLGARVHDGQIISISITDNEALIKIRRLDSSVVVFELNGVDEWNLEFCNGSIVSTIFIWGVSFLSEDSLEIPDSGWNMLYKSRYKIEDIRNRIKRIVRDTPQSSLIHFSCSYGGDIVATCKQVSVYEYQ